MYYVVKTPDIISRLIPMTWHIKTLRPEVFITFDDGPTPGVTDWVLDLLAQYNAKASFFCVGNMVDKNSELVQRAYSEGHTIGNHTFNHTNGWLQGDWRKYLTEVESTDRAIFKAIGKRPRHFRPPYGKITPRAGYILAQSHKIIMWDVIAGDWDANYSPEDCVQNVLYNWRPGSIIVLHDSQKCADKLRSVLPAILQHLSEKRITFSALRW